MYTIQDLFDLSHTRAAAYLAGFTYPWEALAGIGDLIRQLGPTLEPDFAQRAPEVWVHKTAVVAPTAYLGAPCIIGAGAEGRRRCGPGTDAPAPPLFSGACRSACRRCPDRRRP